MTESGALVRQSLGGNLPPLVKTLSGATFDPSARRWTFHDGLRPISVNFERLVECATENMVEALKLPLIWYAENAEGQSLLAQFQHLKYLLDASAAAQGKPVNAIDAALLINFRATLTSDTEWKLGASSAFIKKWHSLGVPGVTDDAIRFLKSIRLKGNRKGVDGPHDAVLAYLLAERERLMGEADARIAAVNDRTILAVAEVVRQVREMRGEAVGGC